MLRVRLQQCRVGKLVEPAASTNAAGGRSLLSEGADMFQAERGAATEPQAVSEIGEGDDVGGYTDSSSAYAFLRRAWERFGHREGIDSAFLDAQAKQDATIFRSGDRRVFPPRRDPPDSCVIWPEAIGGDKLMALYFDWIMPTYRFLYRPIVSEWLAQMHRLRNSSAAQSTNSIKPAQEAVVWMVFSTAQLFDVPKSLKSKEELAESYYDQAILAMSRETGVPRLESVQARIAACLFLLHTGRPNEAWYNLGTTVQLAFALGLHRSRAGRGNENIAEECRRRSFWALTTLDSYMSVMLGRPSLINDKDVNQRYPRLLDDEELSSDVLHDPAVDRDIKADKVIVASVLHAKLARIAKRAAQNQSSMQQQSDQQRIDEANSILKELADWKRSLPVILSEAVHPSSLIPIFRRQTMVLRLAHEHATMLVTRPLLLVERRSTLPQRSRLMDACLVASNTILNMLTESGNESTAFTAFWFTQYVSFNAVSIAYVWLIQRKRGRHSGLTVTMDDGNLLQKAEAVQKQFAEAVETNAPSLRYHLVLEELHQELQRSSARFGARKHVERTQQVPESHEAQMPGDALLAAASQAAGGEAIPILIDTGLAPAAPEIDFPLDFDLWTQLDSFPFSDINFGEW
ncbi:hypothetical protein LTR53_001256 [Teratosphaeriaceae sp. CCFEE 6253]|nr:hypothetical protein LTR53_001256 [Teratosphaeriaceae sp. CCFEE 6253]